MSVNRLYFKPPLPGKPDPTAAFPGEEAAVDLRLRVVKSASLTVCWKKVFDWIRVRYGQHADCQGLEGRRVEKWASELRRKVVVIYQREPLLCSCLKDPSKETLNSFLRGLTPDEVRERLTSPDGVLGFIFTAIKHTNEPLWFDENITRALQPFTDQTKDATLYDFLLNMSIRDKYTAHIEFLKHFSINPKTAFEEEKPKSQQRSTQDKAWIELSLEEKHNFTDRYVQRFTAEQFRFGTSEWTPLSDVDTLINEIEEHGPLAIYGFFGTSYYPKDALLVMERRLEGHQIYYWTKNSRKKEICEPSHAVLLVGAEKIGSQQLVYFIDPNNASDPAHPETQRIYCMSYKTLLEHCIDQDNSNNHMCGRCSNYHYAYYGPKRPMPPPPTVSDGVE